jgi:hypothetical protein
MGHCQVRCGPNSRRVAITYPSLCKARTYQGCAYAGTIVKENGESVHTMPPQMTRTLFKAFRQVAESFGRKGRAARLIQVVGRPILRSVANLFNLHPMIQVQLHNR